MRKVFINEIFFWSIFRTFGRYHLFYLYYFKFDLLLSPLTILQELIFGDEWYSHTSKLIFKFTPIYENLALFLSQKQEFNKNCVQLASA